MIALSGLLCAGVLGSWLWRLPQRTAVVGDGQHVESYGFDLTTCLVPREVLVAAGMPKDGLPALVNPEVFTPAQAAAFAEQLRKGHQGKFIVPSDRVVGVEIAGVARAYPISLLTWHEVVNDTVAGQPILVTYNPLCDSVVVFDRRVGGRTLEFGVSGLVWNSNLVMYDRGIEGLRDSGIEEGGRGSGQEKGSRERGSEGSREDQGTKGESLWSQLQFRAIAGPAAQRGATLKLVPAVVQHWEDWLREHPETTLLAPVRERLRVYKRTYEPYFGSEMLRFPVAPLAPVNGIQLKSPVLAVHLGETWHVVPLTRIAEHAGADGAWATQLGGVPVTFEYRSNPGVAWVQPINGAEPETVAAFWFGWYAAHPPEP